MKKKYFLILHLLFNNTIFTLKNCFINLIFIFSVILYIYIKYLLFVNYVQLNQKIKKIQIDLIYFFEFKHNLNQNYFMRNFFKQLNYTNFDYVVQLYYNILQFLPSILFILILFILIAYSTLVERKILAAFQRWRGPNKVGLKGSTQPLIDGIKLILKEILIPVQSEKQIFILAARWSFICMILLWLILPTSINGSVLELSNDMLLLFCISVLGSLSILLAGWASSSKYSFLGGIWSGAQLISYELVFGLIMLTVMFIASSTQLENIVKFQQNYGFFFFFLPMEAIIFLIIIIAETNRAPFDFAESESELVSGYNTEYSGLPFSLFFIAEYGNILYMSILTTILFFGGWSTLFIYSNPFLSFFFEIFFLIIKSLLIYFFFLWLRGTFPRFRYDQLMLLCWKIFLPICLACLLFKIIFFLIIIFKYI